MDNVIYNNEPQPLRRLRASGLVFKLSIQNIRSSQIRNNYIKNQVFSMLPVLNYVALEPEDEEIIFQKPLKSDVFEKR